MKRRYITLQGDRGTWSVCARHKGTVFDSYARGGRRVREESPHPVRVGMTRDAARALAKRLNDGSITFNEVERENLAADELRRQRERERLMDPDEDPSGYPTLLPR